MNSSLSEPALQWLTIRDGTDELGVDELAEAVLSVVDPVCAFADGLEAAGDDEQAASASIATTMQAELARRVERVTVELRRCSAADTCTSDAVRL